MAEQKLSSSKYLDKDFHNKVDRSRAREEFKDSAESIIIWGFCAVVVTAMTMWIHSL